MDRPPYIGSQGLILVLGKPPSLSTSAGRIYFPFANRQAGEATGRSEDRGSGKLDVRESTAAENPSCARTQLRKTEDTAPQIPPTSPSSPHEISLRSLTLTVCWHAVASSATVKISYRIVNISRTMVAGDGCRQQAATYNPLRLADVARHADRVFASVRLESDAGFSPPLR